MLRYLAACQFWANTLLRKVMAECRFRPPKTCKEEEEKCVASAMPRQRVVDSTLARVRSGNFQRQCWFKSEVYGVVEGEQKDKVVTFEREFNLDKELPSLFLGF